VAAQLGSVTRALGVRLRALSAGLTDSIAGASYLRKWLFLGAAIGVIAGFGAVAFYELLKASTWLFLHLLVGYDAPAAHGDARIRWWSLGALLRCWSR
jgi:chloride channel protein, CIC family